MYQNRPTQLDLIVCNVSNWMGDRQRKHCAQLPGEEIGGTLVRDFALHNGEESGEPGSHNFH